MSGPLRSGRRWQAALVVVLFFAAVAGSAAVGWWYARESPAHQGPIVLVSLGGASPPPPSAGPRPDSPALAAFAAEAVAFERAYTHSPLTLPAHASLLSGQLPPQHGVRDDAGFTLDSDVRTLAEVLRSRGFSTGAAVSTFLLRPESGVAQGFAMYDAELPTGDAPGAVPPLTRSGAATMDAAERWVRGQNGQRFFLFVQVGHADADTTVTRLSSLLKARGLYDGATIVVVGERGADADADAALDDESLRVPLLVKQPQGEGAGRRVASPVQHIDLAPTILDLVRAPMPDDLHGRSLRPLLDEAEASLPEAPLYAEWLAPRYRFGGFPVFALSDGGYRYVRGDGEALVPLAPAPAGAPGPSAEAGRLRAQLDRLLDADVSAPPRPVAAADEERFALFGHLPTPRFAATTAPALDAAAQAAVAVAHRDAAVLIGQKRYSSGIRALQAIVREHPALAVVHYQLGVLLSRTGRVDEAIAALRAARTLEPDASDPALALARALLRAGRLDAAWDEVTAAIGLAAREDDRQRGAVQEIAARVALARGDQDAARLHAEAAEDADDELPVVAFVNGRLLADEGRYEDAVEAFASAVSAARASGRALADLHLHLGESLAHLDRYDEAEAEYRAELRAFPRNVQAFTRLAMLYRASNRDDAVEDVLNELVAATPTPEGYALAAGLWTILGERSRADALTSDARTRFRTDPVPARLAPGASR